MSITFDLPVHTEHLSGGPTVTFTYDGRACPERGSKVASRRGSRVKKDEDGVVTHYPGRHYESTIGSGSTKYYYADGHLEAFERSADYGQDIGRRFVFRDHPSISLRTCLGSTSVIVNGRGEKLWEDRYYPFGDVRYTYRKDDDPGFPVQTQYRYTGQWFEDGLGASAEDGLNRGLYFYGARWYDSSIARFIQPDTIVPEPGNPQSLNRYSYSRNNPVKFTDPSGHSVCEDLDCTRVLHPVSGELIRIRPPEIDWASIPDVIVFIYENMITNATGDLLIQMQNWNTSCPNCAAGLFAWKVRHGGEWDPKPLLQREYGETNEATYWNQLRDGGSEYYYDVWGNIEYGYLGSATNFSKNALLEGAGAEQIGSSLIYTAKEFDLGFLPRRTPGVEGLRTWDDPADQIGIQIGIDLWNTYSMTITPVDIFQAVERTPGLNTR